MEGFVALDNVRQEIVVAFRGSDSTRNWIADFIFALVPFTECAGCYVHTGFLTSWEDVKSSALAIVEAAYLQYPGYTLVLTGHSLGAAVATLAAVDFRVAG